VQIVNLAREANIEQRTSWPLCWRRCDFLIPIRLMV
jgi:hypothetical protein